MHGTHKAIAHDLFDLNPIPSLPLINKLLSKLLDKNCYESDRSFLEELEGELKALIKSHFENNVDPLKNLLSSM